MEKVNSSYILITGAAKRLAKQIAIFLAKKKHNIVIHYNTSKNEANELKKFLQQIYNIECFILQTNFNQPEEILNIFPYLKDNNIFVSTLINSASSFYFDDFFNYDNSKWTENFNTNLKAPYLLSLEFVKNFKNTLANNKTNTLNNLPIQGNIINIVDSWSYKIDSRFLSYNLAKLALWRLTQIMALELAPTIRVNGIAPGLVVKPDSMDEERFSSMYKQTPLPQSVNPRDIAETIWFILNNSSLCGEIIKVDCGKSLNGTHPQ